MYCRFQRFLCSKQCSARTMQVILISHGICIYTTLWFLFSLYDFLNLWSDLRPKEKDTISWLFNWIDNCNYSILVNKLIYIIMAIDCNLRMGGGYIYPRLLQIWMWGNSPRAYWNYREEEWYSCCGNAEVIRCIVRALNRFLPRQNISGIVLTCFLYEWAITQGSVLISLEPVLELTTSCNYSLDKVHKSLLQSPFRL